MLLCSHLKQIRNSIRFDDLVQLGRFACDFKRTGISFRDEEGGKFPDRSKTELQKYCTENAERIHRLDEDTFDTISVMIDQPDFVKRKENYRKGERIDMCQAMADWKKDILREGVRQGIDRGIKQGISRGLEQGIEALILDNLEEGVPEIRIIEKLQKRFVLEEESARSYFMKYAAIDMD